jgi:hypothetical protein
VGTRAAAVDGQRAIDQVQRAPGLALLARQGAAQVQGIEVKGLGAQHLIIEGLRAAQFAILVQCDGLLQECMYFVHGLYYTKP